MSKYWLGLRSAGWLGILDHAQYYLPQQYLNPDPYDHWLNSVLEAKGFPIQVSDSPAIVEKSRACAAESSR